MNGYETLVSICQDKENRKQEHIKNENVRRICDMKKLLERRMNGNDGMVIQIVWQMISWSKKYMLI